MQFSDILASSIHDIKNSLGIIYNRLDELLHNPQNTFADPRQAYALQREIQRSNNTMIQLLSLYKMGSHQLTPSIQEHNLEEFLLEIQAENQSTCEALGFTLSHESDPELYGYFDRDLITGIINSTIGNALRYAKSQILLQAEEMDGYLIIRIQDDGPGYPDEMLNAYAKGIEAPSKKNQSFSSGRTNLGLFFASQVAALHKTNSGQGRIQLSNTCSLGGSCFELYLP